MTQATERPAGGRADLNSSLLASFDSSDTKKSPIKNQDVCPIIVARQCRMVADLLAESVEIAMACGIGVLAAAREGDDDSLLHHFKGFDAGARSARRAAEQIREAKRLRDTEGSK
jgi:hypothetical protein